MSKEAYYFSHDANARQDEKILMLRAEHGWEGYGIYWALVEMMFENADTMLHLNKTKGISVSYNIDITLLESVINTCITEELFSSDGVKFWSESLIRRKGKYQEIKEKKSAAGKKGMEKRWGKIRNDNTVITDDNTVITKNNKGKEMKLNKLNKLNTTSSDNEQFAIIMDFYQNNLQKGITETPFNLELIGQWFDEVGFELLLAAMKVAAKSEVKGVKFIEGVLKNWREAGVKTLDDARKYQSEFKTKGRKQTQNGVDWEALASE